MKGVLFASDLHLSPQRPDRIALFFRLLEQIAPRAEAIYLLGDVVEFWVGDDDVAPAHRALVEALALAATVCPAVYVMTGNRDFLMGERFFAETKARPLADFEVVDLFGTSTLLTHGDLLCINDLKYQAFRQYVRAPDNQRQFLSLPLAERYRVAAQTRSGTQASMLEKEDDIMDVDPDEVVRVMQEHRVSHLIHGHTHRPAVHRLEGAPLSQRIVLGDWYTGNQVLWCTGAEKKLIGAAELIGTLAA
ncbi:MAG: UDP-2,3-diacylglucosamine diphosphatase [Gammaproteobacteria bacterium]|nr:UDP-2,3-diacylglucosamine diphosphatase [Gammaproteobacteria bacterium]